MFERFTEKARRAIFFARFEASQYGSPCIATEHLLLGLLREDRSLARWFPNRPDVEPEIRAEIETHITPNKRIPTSIEIPLSADCKRVLQLAGEAADRLGHPHVEPVHLLLGLLRVETSLAARILNARALKSDKMMHALGNDPARPVAVHHHQMRTAASTRFDSFLAGLKWLKAEELIGFFAQNGQFVDATGNRWSRDEMLKGSETLLAPYEKKNARFVLESRLADSLDLCIATVLWKNVLIASISRAWMHRMSLVLIPASEDWEIILVHITPVQWP